MIPEIIVAHIELNLAKVHIGNMGADLVQEVTVMGNNDNGVLKASQEVLQPLNRSQIQMVGRLVQQQDIRIAKESLCQQHTNLQGRIHFGHLLVVIFFANAQTVQQLSSIGLSIPAVQLRKLSLQLTGTYAVLITEIRLGINGILFVHNVHQMLVAHNNGAEHLILVKGIVILLQYRHTLAWGNLNGAFGWLNIPAQELQESGFAGTVGTDNAIAVAWGKFNRYILKQDTLAKLQGYATC